MLCTLPFSELQTYDFSKIGSNPGEKLNASCREHNPENLTKTLGRKLQKSVTCQGMLFSDDDGAMLDLYAQSNHNQHCHYHKNALQQQRHLKWMAKPASGTPNSIDEH